MSFFSKLFSFNKKVEKSSTNPQLDLYLKRIADRWKGKGLRQVVVKDHGYGCFSVVMEDKDQPADTSKRSKFKKLVFILTFVVLGVLAHRYCLHQIKNLLDVVTPNWQQQINNK